MNCWSLNLPGVSLYTLVTISVTIVFFRARGQGPIHCPSSIPFLLAPHALLVLLLFLLHSILLFQVLTKLYAMKNTKKQEFLL